MPKNSCRKEQRCKVLALKKNDLKNAGSSVFLISLSFKFYRTALGKQAQCKLFSNIIFFFKQQFTVRYNLLVVCIPYVQQHLVRISFFIELDLGTRVICIIGKFNAAIFQIIDYGFYNPVVLQTRK